MYCPNSTTRVSRRAPDADVTAEDELVIDDSWWRWLKSEYWWFATTRDREASTGRSTLAIVATARPAVNDDRARSGLLQSYFGQLLSVIAIPARAGLPFLPGRDSRALLIRHVGIGFRKAMGGPAGIPPGPFQPTRIRLDEKRVSGSPLRRGWRGLGGVGIPGGVGMTEGRDGRYSLDSPKLGGSEFPARRG